MMTFVMIIWILCGAIIVESAEAGDHDSYHSVIPTKKLKNKRGRGKEKMTGSARTRRKINLYRYDSVSLRDQMQFERELMNDETIDLLVLDERSAEGNVAFDRRRTVAFDQYAGYGCLYHVLGEVSSKPQSKKVIFELARRSFSFIHERDPSSDTIHAVLRRTTSRMSIDQIELLARWFKRELHDADVDADVDADTYNSIVWFLQCHFEQIIDEVVYDCLHNFDGSHIPERHRQTLLKLNQTNYIKSHTMDFFEQLRALQETKDKNVYIVAKQLIQSVNALRIISFNFEVAKLLNHNKADSKAQTIAIVSSLVCADRMIDDVLSKALDDGDLCIQRRLIKKKRDGFIIKAFDPLPTVFNDDVVRFTKYEEDEDYLFEDQLYEANDPRNDLVIVHDQSVLKYAKITKGRYAIASEIEVQFMKILNIFDWFVHQIHWRQIIGDDQKRMCLKFTTDILKCLSKLDRSVFDSILYQFNASSTKYVQYEIMIYDMKNGYEMMGKYEDLNDIKIDYNIRVVDNGRLDAIFSFVDIVFRELFVRTTMELKYLVKDILSHQDKLPSTLVKACYEVQRELSKGLVQKELKKFETFMRHFKRRTILGYAATPTLPENKILLEPDIISASNNLILKKEALVGLKVLYEWKQNNDKSVVFVAAVLTRFEEKFTDNDLELAPRHFGYQNVAIDWSSNWFRNIPDVMVDASVNTASGGDDTDDHEEVD